MNSFDPPEPIKSTRFATQTASGDGRQQGDPPRVLLITITVVLGLVALLVVFVLPRWIAAPESDTTQPTVTEHGADIDKLAASEPGDSADDPELREQTQEKLKNALEQLSKLESMSGEHWAKAEVHAIREELESGEKAYREKRYVAAQNIYASVTDAIDRLLEEIPTIVERLLDAGNLALANGISAEAEEAFRQVLTIEPDNTAAQAGRARAATLDQVLALVGQAEGYESLGQTQAALRAYQEALKLDAQAPGAASAVARITAAKRSSRFRDAMGNGFSALAENRFSAARKHFNQAKKLDGAAESVDAALRQVDNAESSYFIDKHLAEGNKARAAERWDQAHTAFSAALKFDERLSPALAGRDQAAARRRLDVQLVAYLARPERLSSDAVHREASAVLESAKQVSERGPKINRQIANLGKALELAKTPISVRLLSDNATQVTVYRIGELGTFDERSLELLPGKYTAVGKRAGYRDVRVEFSLAHAAQTAPVVVQCKEKFAFGN